jgi:glycerophosphoryl diester phosphodiesterase
MTWHQRVGHAPLTAALCVLLLCGAGRAAGQAPAPDARPAPATRPVRVALFADAGMSARCVLNTARCLPAPGYEVIKVTAADVRTGKLKGVDVLFMPGGMSQTQGEVFGADGREVVRSFVRAGGGYVGSCAGAYLATADPDYNWSLGLLNAKVVDKAHWARGHGPVKIKLSPDGRDLLGVSEDDAVLGIEYWQGPLLAPAGLSDLPAYRPLATFETEMAENGAPAGVMKGTTAVAAAPFGDGRVICLSPHAELTPGLDGVVRRAVGWAAKRDLPPAGTDPAVAAGPLLRPGPDGFRHNGVTAHRGNQSMAAENTLPAFADAIFVGADWIELDVHTTKDGKVVVSHDPNTGRVGDKDLKIADSTYAELKVVDVATAHRRKSGMTVAQLMRARLPLLTEVLALVKRHPEVRLSIQPKDESTDLAVKLVQEAGMVGQVGFNDGSLAKMARVKELEPKLIVHWDRPAKIDVAADLATARKHKFESIVVKEPGVTPAVVRRIKEAGFEFGVWTVDDPKAIARLLDMGVDRIYTNTPEVMLTLKRDRATAPTAAAAPTPTAAPARPPADGAPRAAEQ